MLKGEQDIIAKYERVKSEIDGQLVKYKKRIDQLSLFRVALLLVEVLIFVYFVSSTTNAAQYIGGAGLVVPVVVFIIVVTRQERAKKEETALKNLLWVYQNELNVIKIGENGYDDGQRFEDEMHPYLSDLDIFGKHSLFNLINRSVTKSGLGSLAKSLNAPLDKDVILQRQAAVIELTIHIDDTCQFRANLKGGDASKLEEIKEKLKGPMALQLAFVRNNLLRAYVKLLPFLTPTLILGGLVFGDRVWGIFTLLIFINATISFLMLKKVNLVYFGFTGSANLLSSFALAIRWIEDKNWESTYIKNMLGEQKVSDQIKDLGKIIQSFDARLNILVAAFLNCTLLWDLRCSIRLDVWHAKSASKISKGLASIGDFEELISLATFANNHPNTNFPTIKDDFSLSATNLDHPLIPLAKRIANNFAFRSSPNVNIITGSNMAGKSTFLRTVGINMVLAYAGAPVLAKEMALSIFSINTYMRIKDSINESTSTFKAELIRLKMILNNIKAQKHPLVLIDEMLRGTNSHDKYLGSKVFIEKMIELNAPTIFATHDLHLADMENEQPEKVVNYHFDIQIEQGEMKFDYKLKQGPCKIFNAAILLKEIGLSLD